MKRGSEAKSNVIDLASERGRRRIGEYERRIRAVLDANRRALGRLFSTGLLFTRQGSRAGRDLLLAHQHLLKVVDLLGQLSDWGDIGAAPELREPPRGAEIEALYEELDSLLERTNQLTTRTGDFLATLARE
jgi:hypothetical protein